MAENTVPLLQKCYFEDCPGCRVDRRKAANRGMPYKEFFFVFIVQICNTLPISSLFPFLYFMIRDLNIAKRVEDIGFYAGFLGSSFMLARTITAMFWGMAADRFGRKPVILIGTLSVVIFNTLFGLSTSYWMAIITRVLLGALNGVLGPIKAYSTEVCRPEHQAIGLSIVSTAWGLGLIIGPAIGGFFAQPADKFPDIFSKESIFGRFPYFLPCLFISFLAACVFVSCIWLPETLHVHKMSKTIETVEDDFDFNVNDGKEDAPALKENLLKNWPLMSSIIIYCVFSYQDMAYTEIFSLWAESDRKYGGLSYSTDDVGAVLSISGAGLLVYQLLLYHLVEKVLGPVVSSRIAAVLSIPLLVSYPYMANLSGFVLAIIVNIASVLRSCLVMTVITGTFILQNNAVAQGQRGAANGISLTAMSFFKAIAPASAGVIFSWAQERQEAFFLPGDQLVFFILYFVGFVGFLLTFKPFLALPRN